MPAINITGTPYDLVNISNSGNILQFIQNVNNLTDHTFMMGILFASFVILFISVKNYNTDTKEAFMASGFVTAVLAIFFSTLNFISVNVMLFIVIPYAIAVAIFLKPE